MSPFILLQLSFVAAVSAQGYNANGNQVYGVGFPSVAFQQQHQRRLQQSFRPGGYPPSSGGNNFQYRPPTTPMYGEQQTTTPYNFYILTTTQVPNYYQPTTTTPPIQTYGHGGTAAPSYGREVPSAASRYESRLVPGGPPSQSEYRGNNPPRTTVDQGQQLVYGEQETTTKQPYEQPSFERRRYPPSPYIPRRRPSSGGSYGNEGSRQSTPYNRPSGPPSPSIYSTNERPSYENERPREYGHPPTPVTPSPYAVNGGGRPQTEASRPGVATYAPPPPPGVGRIEGIIGPNALNHGSSRPASQVPPSYPSPQVSHENWAASPAPLPYHPEFGYPYFADDTSYYFRVPSSKLRKYFQTKN